MIKLIILSLFIIAYSPCAIAMREEKEKATTDLLVSNQWQCPTLHEYLERFAKLPEVEKRHIANALKGLPAQVDAITGPFIKEMAAAQERMRKQNPE